MKQRLSFGLMTLLLGSFVFLSGCFAPDQPSDEQIQSQAKAFYNQLQPSLFEAVSIEKTNGYKQNDTHYVAELTLIVRAKQSLESYINSITHDPSLSPLEKMTSGMQAGLMKLSMADFDENDTFEYHKNYLFIKTDKGWLLKKDLTDDHNP
ncbi:hypothetical protein [Thiosulfativibrio zosterae]|uniref:Lipoprotein n=1 Tax=Thiosulfativibrio zosterae TaxID=2675053 RepID=A0A6F8PQR2_9GAMM|nr:hypothetical protein [Thiosulfativibrio zosterae]BBP44461.1 hypothetical protein THMIRHAT_22070 [Thiosulfativibrio zosterae]